ncbi:hypothetical protein [Sinorhizobium meliloti]|uniref:hypothetical protein n=1 Tax=Rhizobium meliloti TaxID=382 RepID=UPI00398CD426
MKMNPAIEEDVDKLDDDLELLKELLGDEPALEPKAKSAVKRNAVAIANMTDVEFKAYKAQKQASRRASLKAPSSGSVKFDAASTREALADAALLLLATGAPGADAVMAYLSKIYHDQVGAPLAIRSWAKSGKLKPKLLHIACKSS